jgi:hypothetical protein
VNVRRSKFGRNGESAAHGNGNANENGNGNGHTNGDTAHSANGNAHGLDRRIDASGIHVSYRVEPAMLDKLRATTRLDVVPKPAVNVPQINSVENVNQPGTSYGGTAGDIIKLEGSRLSFDRSDKETGVFLVSANGKNVHRSTVYSRSGSAFVDFELPALPAGTYTLEVRTRPSQKDVRVGAAEQPFTVTDAT